MVPRHPSNEIRAYWRRIRLSNHLVIISGHCMSMGDRHVSITGQPVSIGGQIESKVL